MNTLLLINDPPPNCQKMHYINLVEYTPKVTDQSKSERNQTPDAQSRITKLLRTYKDYAL